MVVVSKNIAVDYCHLEVGLREVFLPASAIIITIIIALSKDDESYKCLSYY